MPRLHDLVDSPNTQIAAVCGLAAASKSAKAINHRFTAWDSVQSYLLGFLIGRILFNMQACAIWPAGIG
jgi:hypothetical protein